MARFAATCFASNGFRRAAPNTLFFADDLIRFIRQILESILK
jgi:hypothetical protein